MPYLPIPGTTGRYALIAFDAEGVERSNDPAGRMSQRIVDSIGQDSISDVFMTSHGWKGDIPGAQEQYDAWVGAMAACGADRSRAAAAGEFRPLVVALHWPSQPWGDEEFDVCAKDAAPGATALIKKTIGEYAARLADTQAARTALGTIFSAAAADPAPETLPVAVRDAYAVLDRESGLGGGGVGASPDADREPFEAEERYQNAREEMAVSFGIGSDLRNLVLSPLRQLSFWKMKKRACRIGETCGHDLLQAIMRTRPGLRVHLSGHSFGCIVASASIAGPGDERKLPYPVSSLVLIQGAMSLWSYCQDIPALPGSPGYFRRLVDEDRVGGPIVSTRSKFDFAVGRWYPRAAGVLGQVVYDMDDLPEYGGTGSFGLQGPGLKIVDAEILAVDQAYDFKSGTIYNLECSGVICNGTGASGAHSDIAHPQVAHAVWSAALV